MSLPFCPAPSSANDRVRLALAGRECQQSTSGVHDADVRVPLRQVRTERRGVPVVLRQAAHEARRLRRQAGQGALAGGDRAEGVRLLQDRQPQRLEEAHLDELGIEEQRLEVLGLDELGFGILRCRARRSRRTRPARPGPRRRPTPSPRSPCRRRNGRTQSSASSAGRGSTRSSTTSKNTTSTRRTGHRARRSRSARSARAASRSSRVTGAATRSRRRASRSGRTSGRCGRSVCAPSSGRAPSARLRADVAPGDFVVLDQLVDRTRGRDDTYYDADHVHHVSFADPYCPVGRTHAIDAASRVGVHAHATGTIVVINGPRFSTRAESRWYRAQGWDVVGMTQYPEAYLARELGMHYTGIALVTDYDTGVEDDPGVEPVTMDQVLAVVDANVGRVARAPARAAPEPARRPDHVHLCGGSRSASRAVTRNRRRAQTSGARLRRQLAVRKVPGPPVRAGNDRRARDSRPTTPCRNGTPDSFTTTSVGRGSFPDQQALNLPDRSGARDSASPALPPVAIST